MSTASQTKMEVVVDCEEPILSEELREALGDGVDLVLPSRKPKRKVETTPEHIMEVAKVMTKKAKKRAEQIRLAEERETKRSTFLANIQKHVISEVEQQLITSTRHIGQVDTMKQMLSKTYKRFKAGMPLSAQEHELLFPSKSQDSTEVRLADLEAECFVPEAKLQLVPPVQSAIEDPPVLIDIAALNNEIMNTQGIEADSNRHDKKKKQKKKSSKHSSSSNNCTEASADDKATASAPPPLPPPPLSLGSMLLQQLGQLKATSAVKSASLELEQAIKPGALDEASCDNSDNVVACPYKSCPIDVPLDLMSHVVNSKLKSEPVSSAAVTNKTGLRRVVKIERDAQIQAARLALPVCAMEQEIVEAISQHDVVILCGETGSGKSTQIPQFLYEAGYGAQGMIGITQPRRVAATSTAQRVAHEVSYNNSSLSSAKKSHGLIGDVVGYQIRHDMANVTGNTRIKFMTDGILLREIANDLLMSKYSVIILDEAHERNINTDVLLGMLSRSISIRKQQSANEWNRWRGLSEQARLEFQEPIQPLRLVIMSATLRVDDFCNPILFPRRPPVIKVDARQYPVTTHFARRTEVHQYLKEAYKKVCQIHRKLPDGGVLVFLTGKREVMQMCDKLNRALNGRKHKIKLNKSQSSEDREDEEANDGLMRGLDDDEIDGDELDVTQDNDDFSSEDDNNLSDSGSESDSQGNDSDNDSRVDNSALSKGKGKRIKAAVEGAVAETPLSAEELEQQLTRDKMLREALGMSGDFKTVSETLSAAAAVARGEGDSEAGAGVPAKAIVLPLFAMMSSAQQNLIFKAVPPGYRLIIVATNVAETSITIPGIRYVVDTGRQKVRVQDMLTGVTKYEVRWISKAAAEQRKGRAGRTGPGHCYRLFSAAFFDQHMAMFQAPEILSTPLEDLLLQMRAMGISDVENFPFPTSPPPGAFRKALELLVNLGAIVKPKGRTTAVLETQTDNSTASVRQMLLEKGSLSALGQSLSKFPINPRYAKMLIAAQSAGVLAHCLALVCMLVEKTPFNATPTSANNDTDNADNHDNDSDGDEQSKKNKKKLQTQEDKSVSSKASKLTSLRCHSDGDALIGLRVLGAYNFHCREGRQQDMANRQSFCDQHRLVQAVLQRATDLFSQMSKVCTQNFCLSGEQSRGLSEALSAPPSSSQEVALRQVLVTGFGDCIARKISPAQLSVLSKSSASMSRRKRLTAYLSCNPAVTEPLYIHPNSCLYSKDPSADHPEYVCYSALLTNQTGTTTYMTCLTVISQSWLHSLLGDCPLLQLSAPLGSPLPYYDTAEDCVMCYVVPKFGAHAWELPPVKRPLHDCIKAAEHDTSPIGFRKRDETVRWFARLLLEGAVLPELRGALRKDKLKESATGVTDMKLHEKTLALLRTLCEHNVVSKKILLTALHKDKNLFTEEIQQLLQVDARKEFRKSWTRFMATNHL